MPANTWMVDDVERDVLVQRQQQIAADLFESVSAMPDVIAVRESAAAMLSSLPVRSLADMRIDTDTLRAPLLEFSERVSAYANAVWEQRVAGLATPEGEPLEPEAEAGRILVGSFRAASQSAFAEYARDPDKWLQLTPREFEIAQAELFAQSGFRVELTAQSGDRGVDFYAAKHSGLGQLLYVVECKRYRPDRYIKPELVRSLRGVVDREQASCGVLITTSTFSPGARAEQRSTPYRLSLRDLEDITRWAKGEPVDR